MKTKVVFFAALVFAMLLNWRCTKEEALEPRAEFTLSITDNVGYVMEDIVMRLQNAQGEFLTYYTGDLPNRIYHPDSNLVVGTAIDQSVDSVIFKYRDPGTFQFTLLAASSGNWTEDYVTDTKTVEITIYDRRTGFKSFKIDKVDGSYNSDKTIISFYATKGTNLTAKIPAFTTDSPGAVVYIGDVVQETGKSVVDFSPINPDDPEGRPVEYKVVAPNGASKTYIVKYVLSDPA